jgi:hypothetical protein
LRGCKKDRDGLRMRRGGRLRRVRRSRYRVVRVGDRSCCMYVMDSYTVLLYASHRATPPE